MDIKVVYMKGASRGLSVVPAFSKLRLEFLLPTQRVRHYKRSYRVCLCVCHVYILYQNG